MEQYNYFSSCSERETENVGILLASQLQVGNIVSIQGPIGVGKTTLIRGIAKGLGYEGRVTSATYTLVNEYVGGRIPLYHFDMFRIREANDILNLGLEDYFEGNGVCATEWRQKTINFPFVEAITVTIAYEKYDANKRRIAILKTLYNDNSSHPQNNEGEML